MDKSSARAENALGASRAVHRATWLYPLLWALLVPALLGVFMPHLASVTRKAFAVAAGFLLLISLVKAYVHWYTSTGSAIGSLWRRVLFLPPFIAIGTDLDDSGIPWCTVMLISANVAAFAFVPAAWSPNLCFPPHGSHTAGHLMLSAVTSAFLHADLQHLFVNMAFLWTFGAVLEPRMGAARLLTGYGLALASSQITTHLLLHHRNAAWGSVFCLAPVHTLGASGAVFGLMAFFIVRCYFARVTIGLPLFLLPFGAIRARVPGLVLVSFFVLLNTVGGIVQLGPLQTGTNYWAHMGGYLGGFVLAYLMGLHKQARHEAVIARARRLRMRSHKSGEVAALYGNLLKRDPENESALRYFLDRYKRLHQERALPYYRRLVQVLLKRDLKQAASLVEAYPSSFTLSLPPAALFRLGIYHHRSFRADKAEPLLRLAAMGPGPWQAKSMMMLAETLHVLGRDQEAVDCLSDVASSFPNGPFRAAAVKRMGSITGA